VQIGADASVDLHDDPPHFGRIPGDTTMSFKLHVFQTTCLSN
jgi:hypothetical protein